MARDIDLDSEKEEDGHFASIVSSLKKRKEKRKDQKECDKKRRGTRSGGVDEEKLKL